jgi:hypothetical protein
LLSYIARYKIILIKNYKITIYNRKQDSRLYKLEQAKYEKVIPLLQSSNELSVYSVIHGIIPGEIFVNDCNYPAIALIQTSECNLLTGNIDDVGFNSLISDCL